MDLPVITNHAERRWAERFPDRDMLQEFLSSTLARKKSRKLIAKQCGGYLKNYKSTWRGYYYLIGSCGVIFVMAPPKIIVTVFEKNQATWR